MKSANTMRGQKAQEGGSGGPGASAARLALKNGQVIRFHTKDSKCILRSLRWRPWPKQSRRHVDGLGSCLGVTYNGKQGYVGPLTRQREELVKLVNALIGKSFGSDFKWSSIQVNHNTVAVPHTDANNLGKSVVMLLGKFEGGEFVCKKC